MWLTTVFPYFASQVNQSVPLGASASIMAIILAVATKSPNYTIRLLLIGDIRMKYFAGITVLISVLSVAGENAGGEFAHLGGALVGFLYVYLLNKGTESNCTTQSHDRLVRELVQTPTKYACHQIEQNENHQ